MERGKFGRLTGILLLIGVVTLGIVLETTTGHAFQSIDVPKPFVESEAVRMNSSFAFNLYRELAKEKQGGNKKLNDKNLISWINRLSETPEREIDVTFPKFRSEQTFDLNDTLNAMGMKDAFTSGVANFAGLTNSPEAKLLSLSKCIHQSLIQVDEGERKTTAVVPMQSKDIMAGAEFNATHPFIYLIRHKRAGTILFLGRMMNPNPGAKTFASFGTTGMITAPFNNCSLGGFHIVGFDIFGIRGRAEKIMLCLNVSKSMFEESNDIIGLIESLHKKYYLPKGSKKPKIHCIGYNVDKEGDLLLKTLSKEYKGQYRWILKL